MMFFSAPLTTRAPLTTVRQPSDDRPPAVRQPSTVPMILWYLTFPPDPDLATGPRVAQRLADDVAAA